MKYISIGLKDLTLPALHDHMYNIHIFKNTVFNYLLQYHPHGGRSEFETFCTEHKINKIKK
jgi:hypothetical protein